MCSLVYNYNLLLFSIMCCQGQEKIQTISKLSFVSCVAVGDVLNENRNVLVIITADGWCYVYAAPEKSIETSEVIDVDEGIEQVKKQVFKILQHKK